MALRIAIQGYGRIGRLLHRKFIEDPVEGVEIVAINSRSSTPAERAHLLKYDSVHGKSSAEITADDSNIIANGVKYPSFNFAKAADCPWDELNIDVVIETTGRAKTADIAQEHIDAGAKKVLVSAPMKDSSQMVVLGVNDEKITDDLKIISNASCTTNCIAPPLKVLHDKFGIVHSYVTTIHSFTHSQNMLDNSASDARRARSGVQNLIPTTTGAMKAIGKVFPDLNGKVDGMAFRIPLATSSACDIRLVFEKDVTAQELNQAIIDASNTPELKGILGYETQKLVSSDFKTDSRSSILDAPCTKATGKNAQMIFWYDNEWGYMCRLYDFIQKLRDL